MAWNSKAVECEKCGKWFHIVCQNVSKEQYDQMGDVCSCCKSKNKTDWDTGNKRKLFERYVDDIFCTVKDDHDKLLNRVNKLHNNLEFTIERLNENHRELAFLDMTVHVDIHRKITCNWYKKPTDNDTTPNFRSCAPLQHKKNIIEGTVHRLLR